MCRDGHLGVYSYERKATLEPNSNQRTNVRPAFAHDDDQMSRTQRTLRIFALPLSKQSVAGTTTGSGKAKTVLNTYFHFVTSSPSEVEQGNPSLISRVTEKVTNMWAGWGKAKPGSWKVGISA